MAENLYFMGNGYAALTNLTGSANASKIAAATTGTAGTWQPLLQVSTPSTRQICVVEYGISLSGAPSGAQLLLLATNTANPVTGAVAGIITPYSNPNAPTSLCTSGTSNSCFYTAENGGPTGTVQAVFDEQLLTTNTYVKQFPLAREPDVAVSNFLNICINVPTSAVTAFCYVVWRE